MGLRMNMWTLKALFLAFLINKCATQQISGYGPVDVAELNPLTLSWNQVHFLVRENLLAIDELRDEYDKIYEELHECFGLERCRKQENFLDMPTHGQNLQAGALLATLRKTRLGLEGQHSVLEQAIRQQQNVYNQQNSFRGSRTRQGPGSFNQASGSYNQGSGSNNYQTSSRSSSGSSSSGSSYRSSYSSSSSSS